MNEKDLLHKLSLGDESAFKEMFMLYYQQLVVFANKMVYDLDQSRDLVQEVIVNFYEKRKKDRNPYFVKGSPISVGQEQVFKLSEKRANRAHASCKYF